MILTAGYILWTIQRVYLGPEYKGPHGEALVPATQREIAIAAPLLAFAILFGVYPQALLNYMAPTVNQTVDRLAEWSRRDAAAGVARTANRHSGTDRHGPHRPGGRKELPAMSASLYELIQASIDDTLGASLRAFLPELVLSGTICSCW